MVRMRPDSAGFLAGLRAEFDASTLVRLVEVRLLSSAGQCARR